MKFSIKILILLFGFFLVGNYVLKNSPNENESPNIFLQKTKSIFQPSSVKILAFGDLMLGRYVETLISRGENMFENISEIKADFPTDYIFTNLENPITESEIAIDKAINLKMSPSNTYFLKENGINLVSLANNHNEDYFQQGINDTIKYLNEYQIKHFGIQNQPLILEKNEIKIGFFGINALWGDITPYYTLIEENKTLVDYLIISIHWGDEYQSQPNQSQIQIGHKLIDAGADIVLGGHPHTTQPIEKYNDGIIFYSLGNFIFDMINPITHKELGVGLELEKNKMSFQLFPMTVVNFKPEPLPYDQAILECQDLAPEIELDECKFVI
ncbi:MAG: CapA family protein [Patescibacteria group bacterium]